MGRSRSATAVIDMTVSDADLATQAASGIDGAFDELYRRHAQVAWRVAQAITGNPDDAADAVSEAFTRVLQALPAGQLNDSERFRPYLLAATRNAAIDVSRRSGRTRPTDALETLERPSVVSGPAELVMNAADTSLVARAFLGLPERWRSVLWLTEVEGMAARDAAELLGLSPNGVAQLAVRARAGLRERFLQAHLAEPAVARACQSTVEKLGAYVAGGLAPRDLAKVDQHLAGCQACRDRREELEDLGTTLRKAVVPLPLFLAGAALRHLHLSLASASSAATAAGAGAGSATTRWLLKTQRPLAVLSVGLLAGGLVGLGVVGTPLTVPGTNGAAGRGDATPAPVILPAAAPSAATTPVDSAPVVATSSSQALAAVSLPPTVTPPAGTGSPSPTTDSPPPSSSTPGNGSNPPAGGSAPVAQVAVYLNAGPISAATSAGTGSGSCTGATLAGHSGGCAPPPAGSGGSAVAVDTSGTSLPAEHIGLL